MSLEKQSIHLQGGAIEIIKTGRPDPPERKRCAARCKSLVRRPQTGRGWVVQNTVRGKYLKHLSRERVGEEA